MILLCRVLITMIIPRHSMIVMFDHSCEPGFSIYQNGYFSDYNILIAECEFNKSSPRLLPPHARTNQADHCLQ